MLHLLLGCTSGKRQLRCRCSWHWMSNLWEAVGHCPDEVPEVSEVGKQPWKLKFPFQNLALGKLPIKSRVKLID